MRRLNKKDIIVVIVSLLFGFTIGAAAIWSYYSKNEDSYLSVFKYYRMIARIAENINEKEIKARHKDTLQNKGKWAKPHNLPIEDSLVFIPPKIEGDSIFYELDSIEINKLEDYDYYDLDSNYNADEYIEVPENINDIVILKEEIIFERTIPIKGINLKKELEKQKMEALIAETSTERNVINTIKIEFWVSPINYVGYKMSRKKLVVFGIKEFKDIAIKMLNDKYFFQVKDEYFKIHYTDDYKRFEKEDNEQIITELNKIK